MGSTVGNEYCNPEFEPVLIEVFLFFHVFNMATSEINTHDCQNNTHSLK